MSCARDDAAVGDLIRNPPPRVLPPAQTRHPYAPPVAGEECATCGQLPVWWAHRPAPEQQL